MKRIHAIVIALALVGVYSAPPAAAQNPGPVIVNATMDVSGEHLTLSGSGFGTAPVVTIDGQPVTVLPGATDTQVTVLTPAALLTTPGTYRVTVTESARQASDVFVVASRGSLVQAGGGPTISSTTASAGTTTPIEIMAGGGTGLGLIESSGSPYTTAIGYSALAVNTGTSNTAAGYMALNHNTTGSENTASGYGSLYWNTTGYDNTASGVNAMIGNTTGYYNASVGASALFSNSSGYKNTAVGVSSLSSATVGHDNAALGFFAGLNATGSYNTFIGSQSDANTGLTNATAIGYKAYVTQSNSLVLGSINGIQGATADTNVGIGTTAPVARLQVNGGETRLQNGNGSYSHFNYAGTSVNYIRGATYFDAGNVGIGTAAPAARLHVSGGEMRVSNGNGTATHFNYVGASVNYLRGTTYFDNAPVYFTGGNIGIGTTTPAYPLHMGSGAHVTVGGVWTDASSRALKEAIRPLTLTDAERALAALQPVRYVYKADPTDAHVGFIAEDVPELVATPDRKSLAPMDIVAVLTKVLQDQQATINDLKATVSELKAVVQEQQLRIGELDQQGSFAGRQR
jgi:hypothetical protein